MATEVGIDLDTVTNPKQRAKLFKATVKEIRSKDVDIKLKVLTKFSDCRYLTDGDCMIPFIESVTIKKKTMEYSKSALDAMILFFEAKDARSGGIDATIKALDSVMSVSGNLHSLQAITEALVFKEEIKKVKPKGKGKNAVEEPPPPEREIVVALRSTSLRAVNRLASILTKSVDAHKNLMVAFTQVPNIDVHLCSTVTAIAGRFEQDAGNPDILQEGMWVLEALVPVLQYNSSAIDQFVSAQLIGTIGRLMRIKCFSMFCAQIFEILSGNPSVLPAIAEAEIMEELIASLSKTTEELALFEAPPVVVEEPASKGKKPAADKGKKGQVIDPEPVVEETPETKLIQADKKLFAVATMKCLCLTLSAISRNQPQNFDSTATFKVASSISKLVINTAIWHALVDPHIKAYNLPLSDALDLSIILLGDIGLMATDARKAACKAGAVASLFAVLKQSSSVITGPTDQSDIGAVAVRQSRLYKLRRIVERSLLCLMTHVTAAGADTGGATAGAGGVDDDLSKFGNKSRWGSCVQFTTDLELFAPTETPHDDAAHTSAGHPPVGHAPAGHAPTGHAPAGHAPAGHAPAGHAPATVGHVHSGLVSLTPLFDTIASVDDEDLANRAVRVLAALLQSSTDLGRFVHDNNLGVDAVNKIAHLSKSRALTVLETTATEPSSFDDASAATSTATAAATDSAASAVAAGEVDTHPTAKLLVPTAAATLYLSVVSLEAILQASADNVNAFANKDNILTLAKLIYEVGPNVLNLGRNELDFPIFDVRNYSWIAEIATPINDVTKLRPLVLDLLAIVARSDAKYRHYEGAVPPAVCLPLPAATAPCREATLTVCKLCADACCSVLSAKATFVVNGEGGVIVVAPNVTAVLDVTVVDAALGLLQAMGSAGADGQFGVVESIFEAIAGEFKLYASLRPIISFLESSLSTAEPGSALHPGAWVRASHHEQFFPTEEVPTNIATLSKQPLLWPFIAAASSVLGVLSNPSISSQTTSLAIGAMKSLCHVSVWEDFIQPVVTDAFGATFLSLGGATTLLGSIGRFGTLGFESQDRDAWESFARYILGRGRCRTEFWAKWAADNAEPVVLDPKTGKPIPSKAKPAKDAKKDAKVKDPKGHIPTPSMVPESVPNYEPEGEFHDPNHGPSAKFWANLLQVASDDGHSMSTAATPLTTAVQSLLSDIAVQLIAEGANVNAIDGAGLSPLSYGLLVGDQQAVVALLNGGANVDALDGFGNPTIKYASLTLSSQDVANVLSSPVSQADRQLYSRSPIELLAYNTLMGTMLDGKVDVAVADNDGNSPLLCSLGLAAAQLQIGGHVLKLSSSSYKIGDDAALVDVLNVAKSVVATGCSVNFCNKAGVAPIHIAAARADLAMIDFLLLQCQCIPNAADSLGYLPIHYASAACSKQAAAALELLTENSKDRPIEKMYFSDDRTGKTMNEKFTLDAIAVSDSILNEALYPSAICKRRQTVAELLQARAGDGMNILQLALSAHVLSPENVQPYLAGNKDERMALALYLIGKVGLGEGQEKLIGNIDTMGMTSLHAASLLFEGLTHKRELTAAEKRTKRYKPYQSNELHILDKVFEATALLGLTCFRPVPSRSLFATGGWTALHGAIVGNNSDLVSELIQRRIAIGDFPYAHFMAARQSTIPAVADAVIIACTTSPCYSTLLNSPNSGDYDGSSLAARPLHLAVRAGNAAAINALLKSPKTELNACDDSSGVTALHEACMTGNIELVRAFAVDRDRLDLLVPSKIDGSTTVDAAIQAKDPVLLSELVQMRKNDVIESVMTLRDGREPILIEMEKKDMGLSKRLGFADRTTIEEEEQQQGQQQREQQQSGEQAPDATRDVEGVAALFVDLSLDEVKAAKASALDEIIAGDEMLLLVKDDIAWRVQPSATISQYNENYQCAVLSVGIDFNLCVLYVRFIVCADGSLGPLQSPAVSTARISTASLTRSGISYADTRFTRYDPSSEISGTLRFDLRQLGDTSNLAELKEITFEFGSSGYSEVALVLPSRYDALSTEEALRQHSRNEQFVRLLLPIVNSAGFAGADSHAHECYAQGMSFKGYCLEQQERLQRMRICGAWSGPVTQHSSLDQPYSTIEIEMAEDSKSATVKYPELSTEGTWAFESMEDDGRLKFAETVIGSCGDATNGVVYMRYLDDNDKIEWVKGDNASCTATLTRKLKVQGETLEMKEQETFPNM